VRKLIRALIQLAEGEILAVGNDGGCMRCARGLLLECSMEQLVILTRAQGCVASHAVRGVLAGGAARVLFLVI
jgi:hypothetical protein